MIDLDWFQRERPKNDKSRVLFVTGDDLGPLPARFFQITGITHTMTHNCRNDS